MELLNYINEVKELTNNINTLTKEKNNVQEQILTYANGNYVGKEICHANLGYGKVISQQYGYANISFGPNYQKKINMRLMLSKHLITFPEDATLNAPLTEMYKKITEIEKEIESLQEKIHNVEEKSKEQLQNIEYKYEEAEVPFDNANAIDYTKELRYRCSSKYIDTIDTVFRAKADSGFLFKINFLDGYTAFGESVRYARRLTEIKWYSALAAEEKKFSKTYPDYLLQLTRENIDFDGVHIPNFIDKKEGFKPKKARRGL